MWKTQIRFAYETSHLPGSAGDICILCATYVNDMISVWHAWQADKRPITFESTRVTEDQITVTVLLRSYEQTHSSRFTVRPLVKLQLTSFTHCAAVGQLLCNVWCLGGTHEKDAHFLFVSCMKKNIGCGLFFTLLFILLKLSQQHPGRNPPPPRCLGAQLNHAW